MKLTVDIVIFGCYISWAVGNNCFFKWDNLVWFLKEKKKFKKSAWQLETNVLKQSSRLNRADNLTSEKLSGKAEELEKLRKKLEKSSWQSETDVIK